MKIITLCGSTRFRDHFDLFNEHLTLQGNIVFSCGCWNHNINDEQKQLLDLIHREKIRMSHTIFVINPGGYIGDSTKNEIAFAKQLGKEVLWMEL